MSRKSLVSTFWQGYSFFSSTFFYHYYVTSKSIVVLVFQKFMLKVRMHAMCGQQMLKCYGAVNAIRVSPAVLGGGSHKAF